MFFLSVKPRLFILNIYVLVHLYICPCIYNVFEFLISAHSTKCKFFRILKWLFFYHLWFSSAWQVVGREHSIKCLLNEWMNPPNLYFLIFSEWQPNSVHKHKRCTKVPWTVSYWCCALILFQLSFFFNLLKHTGHDRLS